MNWTEDQLKEKGYTRASDGHYYFTPTRLPNTIAKRPSQQHWSHYLKEKKRSAIALTSALRDIVQDHSTATTTQEVVNQLLTNYVTLNSSKMTRQKTSKSSSNKSKSRPKRKNIRKSKSATS